MDKCGATEGHLIIFDKRKKISWNEKIFYQDKLFKGKNISIWGC